MQDKELYITYADNFAHPLIENEADDLVFKSQKWQNLLTSSLKNKRLICSAGGRGTGKTTAHWYYDLELCCTIPGYSELIMRGEATSIDKTLIVSLNQMLKYEAGHSKNPFTLKSRKDGLQILFDNGSEINFVGTRDPDKIKGYQPCSVWLNEGSREKKPDIIDVVMGSLGEGRSRRWFVNGKPFSQMKIDTNPDHKKHFLYQRFHDEDGNQASDQLFQTFVMADNPAYSNDGENLNELGTGEYNAQYNAHKHDPTLLRRNVFHEWAAAEGRVYTGFSEEKNVKVLKREDYGSDTKWRIICDWGGTTAIGLMAETGSEAHVFKEYYKKDPSVDKAIDYIEEHWIRGYNIPKNLLHKLITDVEISNRTLLEERGYEPQLADKSVSIPEGIGIVNKAFANEELIINKNSLEHPDPTLKGKIEGLIDELYALVYLEEERQRGSTANKPDPDCTDHACDWLRYAMVDIKTESDWVMPGSFGTISLP